MMPKIMAKVQKQDRTPDVTRPRLMHTMCKISAQAYEKILTPAATKWASRTKTWPMSATLLLALTMKPKSIMGRMISIRVNMVLEWANKATKSNIAL